MPDLTLAFIGPPQITHTQRGEISLTNRKALALLAYLAVESAQRHSRESVLGLLWPDLPNTDARNNLRVTWSQLTAQLGQDDADEPYLLSNRLELQFNGRSNAWRDVAEFEQLLADCEAHPHQTRSTCPECQDRLARAAALYRGEFLSGFSLNDCPDFDEWQFVQRERLHLQALAVLSDLAHYYERDGQHAEAERFARRQLELDPLRERAHRQIMRLLARQGQRAAALSQFEACKHILADELGVEPDAETRLLCQRIKAGETLAAALPTDRPMPTSEVDPSVQHRTKVNLPEMGTPFIGREEELRQIGERLGEGAYRLLSIVGPGGMGKTRLAVQLARNVAHRFKDGACFVSLTALQRANEIPSAVLGALGLEVAEGQPPPLSLWQKTLATLRGMNVLLVLDNFEHLLNAPDRHTQPDALSAVDTVLDVLQQAPGVHLIVTSREQLNLQVEDLFYLNGLPSPEAEKEIDAASAGRYAAVRLFCDRAYRASKSFKLTSDNVSAVVRVCQRVQGNALGIELAATWMHSLTADELADQLEHCFELLETDMNDVQPQHRSMRAVFDYSWRMLVSAERNLLSQLGIFRGGFALASAAAIAGAAPITLTRLRYKSLIQTDGLGSL